jgi:predicted DCC family thiol-disulfide oxidoreductase YuxK
MDRMERPRVPAPPGKDVIVFDGTCVYCSGFARLMARFDHADRFRFVTAHSPLGQWLYRANGLDPVAMETNIVILDGRPHVKMAAFAAAMGALGWPWRAAAVLGWLPKRLSDPLYDWIARNRYRFGRQACVLPSAALRARLIE